VVIALSQIDLFHQPAMQLVDLANVQEEDRYASCHQQHHATSFSTVQIKPSMKRSALLVLLSTRSLQSVIGLQAPTVEDVRLRCS